MEKFITATGKTIDLAIAAALEQLRMDRDSVSVEVLENPRSGFLGIGAQPARVKVTYEAPDEAPKPALSSASRSKPKKPAESKPADGAKVIAPAAPKVIAPAAPEAPRPQDTDGALRALTKPTNAKIALINRKSEAIFASGGGFAEPFGIVKSSRPWRQILPLAKFPRQLHLHPAVTYVHVSSLGCKFASLACGLSQRSASLLTLSTS